MFTPIKRSKLTSIEDDTCPHLNEMRSSKSNSNENQLLFFLVFLLTVNSVLHSVQCGGLFELDIIKYENYHFNESSAFYTNHPYTTVWHHLTNWSISHSTNQLNHLNSNLIYNLCLKEPKARILDRPCTFGEIQASTSLPNQPVSLKEPFTFRWIVSSNFL